MTSRRPSRWSKWGPQLRPGDARRTARSPSQNASEFVHGIGCEVFGVGRARGPPQKPCEIRFLRRQRFTRPASLPARSRRMTVAHGGKVGPLGDSVMCAGGKSRRAGKTSLANPVQYRDPPCKSLRPKPVPQLRRSGGPPAAGLFPLAGLAPDQGADGRPDLPHLRRPQPPHGADEYGYFAFGLSLATVLAIGASMGQQTAILRYWPERTVRDDPTGPCRAHGPAAR